MPSVGAQAQAPSTAATPSSREGDTQRKCHGQQCNNIVNNMLLPVWFGDVVDPL